MFIKKEPDINRQPASVLNVKSSPENPDIISRPPLKELTDNISTTKTNADSKKQPTKCVSTPQVKKEPGIATLQASPIKQSPRVKKPAHSEKKTDKKRNPAKERALLSNDSLVGLLFNEKDQPILTAEQPRKQVKRVPQSPGVYEKYDIKLNEKDAAETDEYYDEVFTHAEGKQECIDLAKCDIEEWVNYGNKLLQDQSQLMSRMIQARIKLSHRFQVVTELINERAEVLLDHGDKISAKLARVENLGKEILELL